MIEFKFPDVGEGITEGEIVKWLVKVGDTVKEDQPMAQVETDKAVVDVPSPVKGTVVELKVAEGATIKVGEVLFIIDDGKESKPEVKTPKKEPKVEEKKESVGIVGDVSTKSEVIPTIHATPAVRKLAKELKVDINKVKGTGKEGLITQKDVEAASGKTTPVVKTTAVEAKTGEKPKGLVVKRKYDQYGYIDRVPFKGIRKTIARNLLKSRDMNVHVTSMDHCDVTELWEIKKHHKEDAAKRKVHLTFTPFFIKAVIAALKQHPMLNSTLDEEAQEILIKKYYNIGFAVDTGNGLLVPVVKIADQKSVLKIAQEITDLAQSARDRTINLGDMKGGSFTITNYGSIGSEYGTPIINPPEVAILGIGNIKDTPWVVDGEIKIRKIMGLSLSFDHRVVDGAEASRFLNTLIGFLEDPDSMLLV